MVSLLNSFFQWILFRWVKGHFQVLHDCQPQAKLSFSKVVVKRIFRNTFFFHVTTWEYLFDVLLIMHKLNTISKYICFGQRHCQKDTTSIPLPSTSFLRPEESSDSSVNTNTCSVLQLQLQLLSFSDLINLMEIAF